jgi:hypothetical protein
MAMAVWRLRCGPRRLHVDSTMWLWQHHAASARPSSGGEIPVKLAARRELGLCRPIARPFSDGFWSCGGGDCCGGGDAAALSQRRNAGRPSCLRCGRRRNARHPS